MERSLVPTRKDTDAQDRAVRSERGYWQLRWRRFRLNRLAFVSLSVLIFLYVAAAAGGFIHGRDPYAVNPASRFLPPSPQHPFGTDDVGRDILARIIAGGRVSLGVGLVAMVIAVCTGIVIGGASGFFEGLTDSFLMRFTDAMLSLPTFFFLLALVALFGGGIAIVVLVIGLTSWMRAARLVRSEFLRWKVREFVLAARAIGAPDMRIIAGHILPQTLPSVLVEATLGVAYAILTESALSFLGLGIRAPTPTWGNMLFNAQGYIWNHAALAIWPGCMILITVLCFNSFGDGLRDAFDPRA